MLTYIAILILVLIAGVLLYASRQPDHLHVERSILIKAPAAKIFAFINDFHRWEAWSPYNKDPAMKKTYSGSDSGQVFLSGGVHFVGRYLSR